MMFGAAPTAPAHDGHGKCGQKIGVAWQDTESASFILGAKMGDVVGFAR